MTNAIHIMFPFNIMFPEKTDAAFAPDVPQRVDELWEEWRT
jgi:hypothetical protein